MSVPGVVQRTVFRRDGECVPCSVIYGACMSSTDTLVLHHRMSRGMGGSRFLDTPGNLLVVCSEYNGLMESDADVAQQARDYGWKIPRHSGLTPVEVPCMVMTTEGPGWVYLTERGDYDEARGQGHGTDPAEKTR